MDLISKKDLLAMTGISYGQLYRWKREGLIPEEWFIKRSAYTGQETFFPRERMISRVNSINELKKTHSLPELAEMLGGRNAPEQFEYERQSGVAELSGGLFERLSALLGVQKPGAADTAYAVAISGMCGEHGIPDGVRDALISGGAAAARRKGASDCKCLLIKADGMYHAALISESADVLFDSGVTVIAAASLSETAGRLLK